MSKTEPPRLDALTEEDAAYARALVAKMILDLHKAAEHIQPGADRLSGIGLTHLNLDARARGVSMAMLQGAPKRRAT